MTRSVLNRYYIYHYYGSLHGYFLILCFPRHLWKRSLDGLTPTIPITRVVVLTQSRVVNNDVIVMVVEGTSKSKCYKSDGSKKNVLLGVGYRNSV